MKKAALLLVLASCRHPALDEHGFEDLWWELESHPICFNMHNETKQLLVYEDRIAEAGAWFFEEPNTYNVEDKSFYITYIGNNCWNVNEHWSGLSDNACECTLIPWSN